jgi:hypothetical protein
VRGVNTTEQRAAVQSLSCVGRGVGCGGKLGCSGDFDTDLIPVEKSFHVERDLVLLRRRERGVGRGDGRDCAESEDGAANPVASAEEEETAAGGGAEAERHLLRRRAPACESPDSEDVDASYDVDNVARMWRFEMRVPVWNT